MGRLKENAPEQQVRVIVPSLVDTNQGLVEPPGLLQLPIEKNISRPSSARILGRNSASTLESSASTSLRRAADQSDTLDEEDGADPGLDPFPNGAQLGQAQHTHEPVQNAPQRPSAVRLRVRKEPCSACPRCHDGCRG